MIANRLKLPPQAVSQQTRLLEDKLQVARFERRGRSIKPTETATLLARCVEAGSEERAEAVRRVTNRKYKDRIILHFFGLEAAG